MPGQNTVKYLVVEFVDGIEIVPTNWLEDGREDYAYWPPYSDCNKILNAAKRRDVPSDKWSNHAIKKVWARTDDYDRALYKLGKLEKSGDCVTTDTEALGRSKRTRRSPQRYERNARSSSSSRSPSPAPSPKRKKTSKQNTCTSQQALRPPPAAPSPLLTSPRQMAGDIAATRIARRASPPPAVASCSYVSPRSTSTSTSGTSGSTTKQCVATEGRAATGRNTVHEGEDALNPYLVLKPVLNRIFQSLEEIKAELRAQKKAISKLQAGKEPARDGDNEGDVDLPPGTFPLTTREDLLAFDRRLDDTVFKDRVVRYLLVFGCSDVAAEVRRMMVETIGHDLAMKYNLTGTGTQGKHSFKDLRLYRVLLDTVRHNHKEFKEEMFKECIKRWLNGAGDRNGGKQKRDQRKRGRQRDQGDQGNNAEQGNGGVEENDGLNNGNGENASDSGSDDGLGN